MKNISKLIIMAVIIWVWLPTGPSDILFIPFIINLIGMQMYIIISIILVIYLYNNIDGKDIASKLSTIKKEIKRL